MVYIDSCQGSLIKGHLGEAPNHERLLFDF